MASPPIPAAGLLYGHGLYTKRPWKSAVSSGSFVKAAADRTIKAWYYLAIAMA